MLGEKAVLPLFVAKLPTTAKWTTTLLLHGFMSVVAGRRGLWSSIGMYVVRDLT
jgi:hypothetical protein